VLHCRSASSTVEIFRSLVTNHGEVDVDKAVSAGSGFNLSATGAVATGSSSSSGGIASGFNAAADVDGSAGAEGGLEGEEDRTEEEGAANTSSNSSSSSYGGARAVVGAMGEEGSFEATAREILLSLPGINVHNFRAVMNSVSNLAELSLLTEDQLQPLIGHVNAKKLFHFFRRNL
jgi:hypothetical protein